MFQEMKQIYQFCSIMIIFSMTEIRNILFRGQVTAQGDPEPAELAIQSFSL